MTTTREPAAAPHIHRVEPSLDAAVALVACTPYGVGGAVATVLAARGATVALCGADTAALNGVAREINASGGHAAAFPLDASMETTETLATMVEARMGPVSVVVNATAAPFEPFAAERLTIASYDAIMASQLKTPFLVTRAVGKRMLDRRAGAIVNIASIGGIVALPEYAAFAAAAGGLFSLTRACAVEWADRGVRVNAVAAGHVEPMRGMPIDRDLQGLAADTPMQRFAAAEEIARAAVFLCSPDASYITGQTLVVDGGWTAR